MLVDAPIFHLAPPSGWVNDPNGPLFYNNRYHLFYQHLGDSRSWSWGLSWGHVSSSDLVHWRHHQPALNPGSNSYDSDGCFSGCAVVLPAAEAAAAAAAGLLGGTSSTTLPAPAAAAAAAEVHEPCNHQQIRSVNHTGSSAISSSSSSSRDVNVLPSTGVPVLLYTGVVLKPDRPEDLKPNSLTVSELCTERQLAAIAADASDPYLGQWRKLPGALLEHPPPGMCLNCFRDPFILERPCPSNQRTWRLMIGAGLRQLHTGLPCAGDTGTAATTTAAAGHGAMSSSSNSSNMIEGTTTAAAAAVGHSYAATNSSSCSGGGSSSFRMSEAMATEGLDAHAAAPAGVAACRDPRRAANGTALVYKSKQLLSGWQFEGFLCTAHRADIHGAVWECPILAQLPRMPNPVNPSISTSTSFDFTKESSPLAECTTPTTLHRHFFSVSTGSSPAVYWLGQYADGKFDLETAVGPLPLDLGDLLYAPNLLTAAQDDASAHVLMWGWLSELPHPHCFTAGCISLPRQLSLSAEGHLLQQPLPQLTALHTGPAWSVEKLLLEPQVSRHIGLTIPSSYFHLQLTLTPNSTAAVATAGQFASSSSAHSLAGIVLPAWTSEGTGGGSSSRDDPHNQNHEAVGQGAVLLYDFATCQLCLTVGPGVGSELVPLGGSTMPVELPPVDAPPDLLPGCQSDAVAAVLQSSLGTSSSAELGTTSSQDGCQSEYGGGGASAVVEKYMPAGGASASNSWMSKSRSGSATTVSLPNGVRQLGGHLRLQPFQPLQLQLFMDYSLLEVFSGDGQVLATRVYRGVWPHNSTDGTSSSTNSRKTAQDAAEQGGLVDNSSVTVAAEGSCNPTDSSSQHMAAAGGAEEGLEALSLASNLSDVACGLQPQGPGGVYLLSLGYSAVAENVSMHAMGSAWIDGGSGT